MSLKNVKSYIGFNVIVLGTVGFNRLAYTILAILEKLPNRECRIRETRYYCKSLCRETRFPIA